MPGETDDLFKSLGLPVFRAHHAFNHFDFRRGGRRILVIGPMGSGKTEYSARVWRDARVASTKTDGVVESVTTEGADRRRVFFVRSSLDGGRFPDYPVDALAYRGGYERCGDRIARIGDSFDLERVIEGHPESGTFIIDEAAFYDERLAYLVRRESAARGLVFIFPTLLLNFRREIFNATARLLLEFATDVFPLTAYCEHSSCLEDSFYTYRYYVVDGEECPAIYFDPLVIIGGDRAKDSPLEPNYCTRCDQHHVLPGKDYTFLFLKPMAEAAASGRPADLERELGLLSNEPTASLLYRHLTRTLDADDARDRLALKALRLPRLGERALVYLATEQNLVAGDCLGRLVRDLGFDREYLNRRFADMGRAAEF